MSTEPKNSSVKKKKKLEQLHADESHSDLLKQLMRETFQEGSVSISFEREPDFFHGTKIISPDDDVWIGIDNEKNKITTCYSCGFRPVYVNGELRKVRYAGDLRIHPDYRGGMQLFRMYKDFGKRVKEDELIQTVILSENMQSMEVLTSGRAGLPTYHGYGSYCSYLICYPGFNASPLRSEYKVRRATPDDIEAMQVFFNKEAPNKQFYPHYDFEKIGSDDPYYRDIKLSDYFLAFEGIEIVGITGIWDQKEFKQTRYVDYCSLYKILRPVYNWIISLIGGFTLPPTGEILRYFIVHTILTRSNDPEIFNALLHEIYNQCMGKKYKAFVCGLASDDPLSKVFDKYFFKAPLPGKHFLMSYHGDPMQGIDTSRQLYLEISRI